MKTTVIQLFKVYVYTSRMPIAAGLQFIMALYLFKIYKATQSAMHS